MLVAERNFKYDPRFAPRVVLALPWTVIREDSNGMDHSRIRALLLGASSPDLDGCSRNTERDGSDAE